jgi:rhodanese-related sulfurtransferase
MAKLIIDVREPIEFKISHVKGAVNLPLSKLSREHDLLTQTPKDTEIILYCHSGNRSHQAMMFFQSLGFTNLKNGINKRHTEANHLS